MIYLIGELNFAKSAGTASVLRGGFDLGQQTPKLEKY